MGSQPNTASHERSYFRVDTEVPLRIRPVRAGERARIERSILNREPVENPDLDPSLSRWLDRIETKLDRILVGMGLDLEDVRPTERVPVVLSGGGIALPRDRVEAGHALYLLDFELPGPPSHLVRALAEPVAKKVEADDSLALQFRVIPSEDRDAIVRHTLDIERNQLRNRSASRSG